MSVLHYMLTIHYENIKLQFLLCFILPCGLGGLGGVSKWVASMEDMWAIPIVLTLPSYSLECAGLVSLWHLNLPMIPAPPVSVAIQTRPWGC